MDLNRDKPKPFQRKSVNACVKLALYERYRELNKANKVSKNETSIPR